MRDFKSMKRQRGRNRKPGGGGGGGGQGNNPNRAFDSNGPEGLKVRGNAQHVYERYQQLARDATSSGDRVLAENFLQHAEHYFRLLRAMQPGRPVSEIAARDAFSSGFDIDFEDESGIPQVDSTEPEGHGEQATENVQGGSDNRDDRGDRDFRRDRDYRDRDGNRDRDNNRDRGEYRARDDRNRDDRNRDDRPRDRDDRPREDRNRDDRPRSDRQRDDRPRDRDDRPRDRDDRARDDRPRDDRPRDDRPRDDRPRDDRPRDDRPRDDRADGDAPRETRRERFDRQRGERRPRYSDDAPAADPLAVVQPQAAPLVKRSEEPSPVLRAEDGGESHMPAFLGRSAPTASADTASDEAAPVKKPRAPRKKKVDAPAGEDA